MYLKKFLGQTVRKGRHSMREDCSHVRSKMILQPLLECPLRMPKLDRVRNMSPSL